MAEYKKSNEAKDYKERFEFRLTVGDNIICQRYFKINNFNPVCLRSYELLNAVIDCTKIIDRDLKDKTQVYLEIYAPRYFDSVEEMTEYLKNPEHATQLRTGEGIVVRNSDVDYFWADGVVKECSYKFDDGELCRPLTDEDRVTYKFAFLVDEQEVCSAKWDGVYPKYIRNSIDISNKKGRFEGEDISRLSFEQYLLYKLVENRTDLVWGLIKKICYACSSNRDSDYCIKDSYVISCSKEEGLNEDGTLNEYHSNLQRKSYKNPRLRDFSTNNNE